MAHSYLTGNFKLKFFIPVLISLAGFFWGCNASKRIDYRTTAVHTPDISRPEKYTLAYSLPKTTLNVSVEAARIVTRRGPYYQYAERFLGITGVPDRDNTEWRIDNVQIGSFQEADPDHYFVLRTNDRHVTNFFMLSEEGFILPVNRAALPETPGWTEQSGHDPEEAVYTDMSIKPWVVEETRTIMRMVRQDTAFVNVPVMQRQSVTRSIEAKAAEVADLIFEIRSNRFKLLSGDLDLFPDGKAIEAIIREFARLEEEYLSLFTGKKYETRLTFMFEYSPETHAPGNGAERHILFRFSDSQGILQPGNVSGRPFLLELNNEMKTSQLGVISHVPASGRSDTGSLFYRIPDVATVKITDGNRTVASRRLPVNQYGVIVAIPADFLWE